MKTFIHLFCILFCLTHSLFSQWSIKYLSETKYALCATSSENRAYFAGGVIDMSGYSTLIDIYEKEGGTWSTSQLSVGRAWMAATNGNGKIFFAGGNDGLSHSENQTSNIVNIYNEGTNLWTQRSLSEGRAFLTAVRVGDKILFAGGIKKLDWSFEIFETSDKVDIYDLNTGQWSTDVLSQPRAFIASAVNGNLAFFAGGWVKTNTVSDVVDIYNSDTDTWSTAILSVARAQAAGASVGNKVLFGGGGLQGSFKPTDVVDIYDVQMNEWSTASLSVSRGELLAETIEDKVFFVGGATIDQVTLRNGSTDYFKEIDIYDNFTGQWSTDVLKNSRVNHAVTALDNKLFVAGGNNSNNVFNEIEVLDLSTVGIFDKTKPESNLFVYPNPVTDILHINVREIRDRGSLTRKIVLHDSTGRLIKEFIFSGSSTELSVQGIPNGLYFVSLLMDEGQFMRKITIF
jgi:hypothetical protein